MSVINKMLRDLDRRNAPAERSIALKKKLAPAGSGAEPRRQRVIVGVAGAMVLAAGAYYCAGLLSGPATPEVAAMAPVAPAPVQVAAIPAAPLAAVSAPVPPAADAQVAAEAPAAPSAPAAPVAAPVAAPDPAPESAVARAAESGTARTKAGGVLRASTAPRAPAADIAVPGARALAPTSPAAEAERDGEKPVQVRRDRQEKQRPAVASAGVGDAGHAGDASRAAQPEAIEKRVNGSPRRTADAELSRAVTLLQQGRVEESIEALRKSLGADPSHETARQTLVALVLEQGRAAEAKQLLVDALEINPNQTAFAMLLARLALEGGSADAAAAVLAKYASSGRANAQYRGFHAAVLQRAGRHAEAIAEYGAALAIAPHVGTWWMGLGISQQAAGERREAHASYQRAKASGSLSGELAGFVDQKLRQVQ